MSVLEIPAWKRAVGGGVGWLAYATILGLFALPRPPRLMILGALAATVRLVGGDSATLRGLVGVRDVIRGGGETAAVLDRLVTGARPEDLVGQIRGAVIRMLT